MQSEAMQQGHRKILVVEDDDSLRELLCKSLSRFGFETIRASNGEEAYRTFSEDSSLDAAVTDYLMPKTDGAELIRKIKAVRPEFPVVLVTGEAPDQVILELAGLPRVIALLKPFRAEGLRQGLKSVLLEPLTEGRPEQRRSTRVDAAVSCSFTDTANDVEGAYFASARNLGFGGCYLQSEKVLPVGSRIRFFFQGLERNVLAGRVVWSGSSGMGIALIPENPETFLFFKKFVLNKLKQKGVGIMGANSASAEVARA